MLSISNTNNWTEFWHWRRKCLSPVAAHYLILPWLGGGGRALRTLAQRNLRNMCVCWREMGGQERLTICVSLGGSLMSLWPRRLRKHSPCYWHEINYLLSRGGGWEGARERREEIFRGVLCQSASHFRGARLSFRQNRTLPNAYRTRPVHTLFIIGYNCSYSTQFCCGSDTAHIFQYATVHFQDRDKCLPPLGEQQQHDKFQPCKTVFTEERTFFTLDKWLERFSIECRKAKTKVITLANHNRRKKRNEPIRMSEQIHVSGAKRGKTGATKS